MPSGLVANQLNNLSNTLLNMSAQKSAHQRDMAELGLKEADMESRSGGLLRAHQLKMAELEREKYMDEELPLSEIVRGYKGFSDEQKSAILTKFPEIGEIVTTRREAAKNWQLMRQQAQEKEKETYKRGMDEKKFGLEEKLTNAQIGKLSAEKDLLKTGGKSDHRSTMEKEVEAMARINNIPLNQALDQWRKDKTLAERIRLYNNELDAMENNMVLNYTEEGKKEKAKKTAELRALYGIDEATGVNPSAPASGESELQRLLRQARERQQKQAE